MNREKLIEFVKDYHKDQVRKYTADPYFNHVLSVATMAEKTGVSYGWEIGLCHDLFEDTECKRNDLYDQLASGGYKHTACLDICKGVEALSDVFISDDFPYLNREIRKQCEALRLSTIDRTSQIIKCCDLIDNTSSIVEHDPGFAIKYLAEKREILKGFKLIDGDIKSQVWNCLLDAEEKLKNISPSVLPEATAEYYSAFDHGARDLHESIDKIVIKYGWKDFVFAILRHQNIKIQSGYKLVKTWL